MEDKSSHAEDSTAQVSKNRVNTMFDYILRHIFNKYMKFYIHGSVHRESNLITVLQDVTYSVYYISVGVSACFGC